MHKKDISFIGAALSAILSAKLLYFGYRTLIEEAQDGAHAHGANGFVFNPDTRWFGLALMFALAASFVASRHARVSFGKALGLLVTVIGVVFIIVPELA